MLPQTNVSSSHTRTHDTMRSLGQATQLRTWLVNGVILSLLSDLVGFLLLGRGRPYRSREQRRSVRRCSPDRFATLVNFLKPNINGTGESAWAWSETRKDACSVPLLRPALPRTASLQPGQRRVQQHVFWLSWAQQANARPRMIHHP